MSMNSTLLRRLVLSLPGVEERETWRHPTFRLARLIVASLPDEDPAIVKASPADQEYLLAHDPKAFTAAPWVGRHGWVSVALPHVAADELRELVFLAWQAIAERQGVASQLQSFPAPANTAQLAVATTSPFAVRKNLQRRRS